MLPEEITHLFPFLIQLIGFLFGELSLLDELFSFYFDFQLIREKMRHCGGRLRGNYTGSL